MMNRRTFVCGLTLGALAGPLAGEAQPAGKVYRVGFLYFGSRSEVESGRHRAFLEGMRELGYVEGKNFVVETRFADGDTDRLTRGAAELVRLNVDVIIATGGQANRAAQRATSTIPIVTTVGGDPVALGMAQSLARPGGNTTGLSTNTLELSQKYVELLSIAVPKASRVGVLVNSSNPAHAAQFKPIEASAAKAGLAVVKVDGRTADEIDRSFITLARERVDAVVVTGDVFLVQQARQIAQLAVRHHLPSVSATREYAEAGIFMTYGPDIRANFHRAATYVDRIFKGDKPAEMPIEEPRKMELIVNLNTAKALGLAVPPVLLLRADHVIQ